MNSVLFVTPGPITWASSRFRAHWVAECMDNAEVTDWNYPYRTSGRDAVVFVKVAAPEIAQDLRENGVKTVWDICDPVHWFNPKEAREMADAVDYITASNSGLAKDFSGWYYRGGRHAMVIPDRMKLAHYPIQREHRRVDIVRFIWFGARQNRHALIGCVPTLARLMANGVNLSVTIYDDTPEEAWQLENIPTLHGRWNLKQENATIAAHDIALLPPYPGAWGALKSNNKHLTAWACGLPVWDGIDYVHGYELATKANLRKLESDNGLAELRSGYLVEQSARELEHMLWG